MLKWKCEIINIYKFISKLIQAFFFQLCSSFFMKDIILLTWLQSIKYCFNVLCMFKMMSLMCLFSILHKTQLVIVIHYEIKIKNWNSFFFFSFLSNSDTSTAYEYGFCYYSECFLLVFGIVLASMSQKMYQASENSDQKGEKGGNVYFVVQLFASPV